MQTSLYLDRTAESETENYGEMESDNMDGTEKGRSSANFRWIVFVVHAADALGLAIALSALIVGAK